MSQQREFWIEGSHAWITEDITPHVLPELCIHVIEYSVYEALKKELEDKINIINKVTLTYDESISSLVKERDELRHKCSAIYQAGHYLGLEAQLAASSALSTDIINSLRADLKLAVSAMKSSIVVDHNCEECGNFTSVRYEITEIKEALAKLQNSGCLCSEINARNCPVHQGLGGGKK